jgi:hypothetical protein
MMGIDQQPMALRHALEVLRPRPAPLALRSDIAIQEISERHLDDLR